jgi:protein phosphatase
LLIAADGLGGHAAGEVASALATRFVAEFVRSEWATLGSAEPERIESLIATALHGAHDAVLADAAADAARRGMGTTLIAAVVCGDSAYIGHVGDVRAYVFGDDGLTQVTDDHSPVGEMVRAGSLSPEQARSHPRKNLISQAIGLESGIEPDVNAIDLAAGEVLLLCSDGLWEALPDAAIAALLESARSAFAASVALVDGANAAGAPDNVTAVVYRHG